MPHLSPVRRALVPIDSSAAARLCSPNYDEFQNDREIQELIARQPESVLRVTMPHCNLPGIGGPLVEGSPQALEVATEKMAELVASQSTRVLEDVLWVYEIVDGARPGVRQIGVGGMARIDEIRTEANPGGSIIRNEGVRQKKARGRADLIRATNAFIGTVNNAVDDAEGELQSALESHADGRPCDFEAVDEVGNRHRVWLVEETREIDGFIRLLASEPRAYVADGNHRSAAAAMLGSGGFLAVFFPVAGMAMGPYNRLVEAIETPLPDLTAALGRSFAVETVDSGSPFQPQETHRIGLYVAGSWRRLEPLPASYDSSDPAGSIDSVIVQQRIFNEILGIEDAADERLTFVGGNRDAAYLQRQVDDGRYDLAVTLPPVTMREFIAVCRRNQIMPPKSTWFQPKIRSGLVMALLD